MLIKSTVWDELVVPTACAGNVSLEGESSNDPPFETPFPVTVTAWVTELPARSALSVMVTCEVCKPSEVGAKAI